MIVCLELATDILEQCKGFTQVQHETQQNNPVHVLLKSLSLSCMDRESVSWFSFNHISKEYWTNHSDDQNFLCEMIEWEKWINPVNIYLFKVAIESLEKGVKYV